MFRGAALMLGLLAGELAAQAPKLPPKNNSPAKYVDFGFDGNPEQMLAKFLNSKVGQDLIQQIIKDRLLDPSPENLEQLQKKIGRDLNLPPEWFQNFLKNHPELKNGNPAEREAALKRLLESNEIVAKQFQEIVKKIGDQKLGVDGMPKFDGPLPPDVGGEPFNPQLPNVDDFLAEDFALDDRIGEWLSDLLKNENFQRDMEKLFTDAPGLRDAFGDLANSLKGPDANGNWLPKVPDFGGGKWNFDFKPPKLPFELGQLPKLPSLKMPQLPRLNLPMPRFGNLGMPRIPGFGRVPNVNMPAAPSVSGGREWVYLILVIMAGGLAWWFLRNVKLSSRAPKSQVAAILRALPASITTRTQLQKAFDTLAIMRFGDQARPWNHRLIARQLGDAAPMTDAAQAFASLYEIARYTPGDDRLSRAEQDAVRDSLAVLTAGVA